MADEQRPEYGRWAQTPTLVALRRLVERGGAVQRTVARDAGLSSHELAALEMLSRAPMGPAELARRLEVTAPAGTGIVDRLVAHGHAERRRSADDRRRVDVHVTAAGRERIRTLLLPMFVALADLDAELDEDERLVITRYLTRAASAMDQVSAQAAHE